MKTLVIGASTKPERFSFKAIRLLRKYEHEVVAIGLTAGKIDDVEIQTDTLDFKGIHTVTLYINKQQQIAFYDYIVSLKPKRLIFNPGTENSDLEEIAKQNSIQPVRNCTLVMLGNDEY
jgi:predicted CoA-binding protein